MWKFGFFCGYMVCIFVAGMCGIAIWDGIYRTPVPIQRAAFGPVDVWAGLALGIPAVIGAITLLINNRKGQ